MDLLLCSKLVRKQRIFSVLTCLLILTSISPKIALYAKNSSSHNVDIYTTISNEAFGGYNLFVLERCSSQGLIPKNRTLLITDLEGNIYLSREFGDKANLDFFGDEFINSTTLLYGDETGAKLWNIETNYTQELSMYGHHDYERNYANNTYFAISKYVINIEGNDYLFDVIREYLEDGTVIWQLDTRDFVSHEQWCPYHDMVETARDITHTNTVFYDEDEDVIYICCRTLNTIYKIDHKTKNVIWSLGEYGDFRLFDKYGKEIDVMFYHAHALEKINLDTFVIFDNDEHNQTNNIHKHSRLLEFKIDTDRMFANITWDWIGSEDYFTGWYGDCDVLPNNNRLGVFGTPWHPGTSIGARLVEVNHAGDKVWEMDFDKEGLDCFAVYKIERFHFAPIVSEPKLTDLGTNGSLVEWDVWYNFRSKTTFQGRYYISVNDELVETGNIDFPKYWQPKHISYQINETDSDIEQISLVVEDEGGHFSNESDRYSSTGKLVFNFDSKLGLILGLTIGLGVPVLIGIIAILWIKTGLKKLILRKNKST